MWQGDQRRREAVVLAGGAGVTRRLSYPTRDPHSVRGRPQQRRPPHRRHHAVAAAGETAAPRPGRPRACEPGRRGSRSSPSAALEQVGPRIGGLDRVPHHVGERRRFPHRGWTASSAAQSRRLDRKPCGTTAISRSLSKPDRVMSSNDFSRAVGNASGPPASTAPPAARRHAGARAGRTVRAAETWGGGTVRHRTPARPGDSSLTARGRSLFAEPTCSGSLAMSD